MRRRRRGGGGVGGGSFRVAELSPSRRRCADQAEAARPLAAIQSELQTLQLSGIHIDSTADALQAVTAPRASRSGHSSRAAAAVASAAVAVAGTGLDVESGLAALMPATAKVARLRPEDERSLANAHDPYEAFILRDQERYGIL